MPVTLQEIRFNIMQCQQGRLNKKGENLMPDLPTD
jgi:hypothetical protein